MRIRIAIGTLLLALGIMVAGVHTAAAESAAFQGIFVSFRLGYLTVMDPSGDKESYRVTKDTQIMSRDGANIALERIRPGTRLSLTLKGSAAHSVIILEVPK